MRTPRILTIMISLLLGTPVLAAGIDLQRVGLAVAEGSGHVNGSAMEVLVLNGASLDQVKEMARKAYTVRELSENGRRTLLVVDGKTSLKALDEAAYVFSELTLPAGSGSLVVGTPLAPLARGLKKGPTSYRGTALPGLPDEARLDVETGFKFGQATVDTSTLSVKTTPALARSLFVTSLAKAGFKASATPSESTEAALPVMFQKGQTVVHLIVNAGDSGSEAKVILHEVSVP